MKSEESKTTNDNGPAVAVNEIDVNGDVEAMFNLRDWMENILKSNGCEITGTGMGFGGADIWFKRQGAEYFAAIKPVMK